jgi:hypothetical protein
LANGLRQRERRVDLNPYKQNDSVDQLEIGLRGGHLFVFQKPA